MRKQVLSVSLIIVIPLLASFHVFGTEQTRDKIAEQYKWNRADIYPTREAFDGGRKSIEDALPKLLECKGRLDESPAMLKNCMDRIYSVYKELDNAGVYASTGYDENMKNLDAQKMDGEVEQLAVKVNEATAWVNPEIVATGKERIEGFLQQEKGLQEYRHVLEDTLRAAPHTLSAPEEAILARTGMLSGVPRDVYDAFTTADMEYPTIKLSDGAEAKITQAAYPKHRASNNRSDRKLVFDSFWKAFMKNQNTLGVLMNAQIQRDWFYAKTRKYDSSLASALDAGNIPVSVYTRLISDINNNLPSLHRYLQLRKRMLGIDKLAYYDMYPPIVRDVDMPFTYQQATKLVQAALKPLGPEYTDALEHSLSDRWVDVYPNEGKQSGAYSTSAYEGHPYVLLNFNDDYEGASTLAHELGHSMHSHFSNKTQAYPNSNYVIFVAEVASTFNENLLNEYMVEHETDPYRKLFLLGTRLELARQTIFRQTQFAEFELEVHRRVERGETLTGADLTGIYLQILKKYYGADKGITEIDDAYGIEWALISQFYRNFYVYQYSTGHIAATALSERVMEGQKGAVDAYLTFLKSGNSDYPIEVLKKAGADLNTSEPLTLTMKAFNRTMDQIEAILKQIEVEKAEKTAEK